MTSSDMERNRFGEYIAGTVYKLIMFISSIPDIELNLFFQLIDFELHCLAWIWFQNQAVRFILQHIFERIVHVVQNEDFFITRAMSSGKIASPTLTKDICCKKLCSLGNRCKYFQWIRVSQYRLYIIRRESSDNVLKKFLHVDEYDREYHVIIMCIRPLVRRF